MDLDKVNKVRDWLDTGSINIFGLPFAGKDTQGRILANTLNAPLIGGGDILRNNPNVPEHVLEIMNRGVLIPTDDYLSIVTPYLSQAEFSGRPLILSSVGRWHGEEEVVLKAAKTANHDIKAVIFLSLNEDEIEKRRQKAQQKADRQTRQDDTAEVIGTRLKEFRQKTTPVIEFYRQQGLLLEIDGGQTPDEVSQHIIEKLYVLASKD